MSEIESKSAPNDAAPARAPAQDGDLAWQREYFTEARLKQARIPQRFWSKTFESFSQKDVLRRRLVEHFERFVQSFNFAKEYPRGFLMIGPVGSGKSHLAVAIMREVVAKGYSGLYYNCPDLLRDIRATFGDDATTSEDEILDEVTEVDLLILDDLGAENVSDFVLDRLYLVINKRYEGCKPIIVTTNLELEELRNRMGERIVSRFHEMCQVVDAFPKEDWRMRSLRR